MENPIKMDDLGVPSFLETPTFWYHEWHLEKSVSELWQLMKYILILSYTTPWRETNLQIFYIFILQPKRMTF